ncbi:heat shock protein transcriptional repressor HspR [Helicobacter pylori]|uniref:heat shock protein transcriptional repressor HspR n=1 Tax=Helicobacter pylori TaxID=210 RepID=UPI000EB0103A|nr:helix-turn-helix transcriptional regulator [Helicobacter pylori]RKV27413.1 MerR family transcriptional regulator [Helicobacter pylori]WQW16881.1 helix-turn-helix transcriptional regulator [Helicobacter pylori]
MCDYDEPLYLISVVAKILGVHPQTLRQYEKEGLIEPSRTDGKMRLYSQRDMDKIKTILRLTRDMGVNLAGVDIILRLKEKLDELDNLNKELQDALHKHSKKNKTPTKNLNTPTNFYELILFKK